MPEKATKERAQRAKRSGKAPSTQAGEFVREEMHHIREGKHGAKSAKQAIAIGLNKARRSGVKLEDESGSSSKPSRKTSSRKSSGSKSSPSKRSSKKRASPSKRTSPTRSAAAKRALKKQPRSAASHRALSRQAHSAASKRTKAQRSASARKAARTRARASR